MNFTCTSRSKAIHLGFGLLLSSIAMAAPQPAASLVKALSPEAGPIWKQQTEIPIESNIVPDPNCHFSTEEHALARLFLNAQRSRTRLQCDPRLQSFARARVKDMAWRQYFSHISPERIGPNEALIAFGYPLPDQYVGGLNNSVESIARGEEDPRKLWAMLIDSSVHRAHLLGQGQFFADQWQYGLAETTDQWGESYWAIIIARPVDSSDPGLLCEPAPGGCRVLNKGPR